MGRFQMVVDDDEDDEAEEKEVEEVEDDDYHDVADHRIGDSCAMVVAHHRAGEQQQKSPLSRGHSFPSFRHYNNNNNDDGIDDDDDGILFPYYYYETHTMRSADRRCHVLCGWWPGTMVVAVVLLAMLCHAYLPPAPPPPTSSIKSVFAGSSSSSSSSSFLSSIHVYGNDDDDDDDEASSSSPLDVERTTSSSSPASDPVVARENERKENKPHEKTQWLREKEEENNEEEIIASSSWRSYLQTHSRHLLSSTKALTIDTPLHIFKWLGISLYHDIKSTYHEKTFLLLSSSSSSCTTTWHIPNSIDTVRRNLSGGGSGGGGVLGQDLAVQLLAEALVGWWWGGGGPTTTSMTNTKKKTPLFVVAVGLRSTGKTTLARAMASLYYGNKNNDGHGNNNNNKPCPLLAPKEQVVLYIAPDDPRTVEQLVHRIQQHVQSYPRGSLIIYHDERLERAVRKILSDNNDSDKINHHNNIETTTMSNAIFYRLSHTLGGSILVQHLRTYGSWGSPAMMADLRAELLLLRDTDDVETTVILPFAPLTPTVLAAIVKHHLGIPSVPVDDEYTATSSVSSSSLSSLLQDVEYMDWTTKQGELILRVALEGARGLPWHRIRALQAAATTARIENERRRDRIVV